MRHVQHGEELCSITRPRKINDSFAAIVGVKPRFTVPGLRIGLSSPFHWRTTETVVTPVITVFRLAPWMTALIQGKATRC